MNNKKQNGLTMIELIVTISLLSIVLAAATGAVISAVNLIRTNSDIQTDQQYARLAFTALTRDMWLVQSSDDVETRATHLPLPNDVLRLRIHESGTAFYDLIYYIEESWYESRRMYVNRLRRRTVPATATSPGGFVSVALSDITVEHDGEGRIEFEITGIVGTQMNFEINVYRMPN